MNLYITNIEFQKIIRLSTIQKPHPIYYIYSEREIERDVNNWVLGAHQEP